MFFDRVLTVGGAHGRGLGTATAHRHRFYSGMFSSKCYEALVKNSVKTHRMPNFQPCHFSSNTAKIKYLKNKHIYFPLGKKYSFLGY